MSLVKRLLLAEGLLRLAEVRLEELERLHSHGHEYPAQDIKEGPSAVDDVKQEKGK